MRLGKLPEPPLKRAVIGQLKEDRNHKERNIGVGCDAGFGIFREKYPSVKNTDGEEETGEHTDYPEKNVQIFAQDTVLNGAAPADLLFGFHRGANSILAAGGIPRWVTVTLLLPENWQEPMLRELMAEIDSLCASREIEILGGQTETLPGGGQNMTGQTEHLPGNVQNMTIQPGFAEPTVIFHFMGTKYREDFPLQTEPGKVHPGDGIVMSGFPAADLAGKWLLEEQEVLRKRFCPEFLAQAEKKVFGKNRVDFADGIAGVDCGGETPAPSAGRRAGAAASGMDMFFFENGISRERNSNRNGDKDRKSIRTDFPSIEKAACLAMDFGVTSMHDIGEGGIFGALRELGERENCGLAVDLKKIPIQQEVIELCEVFDRNPYLTKSCGALLMVTSDPEGLVRTLTVADIPAAIIGKITDDKKMTIYKEEEIRYLDHPQMDECWR